MVNDKAQSKRGGSMKRKEIAVCFHQWNYLNPKDIKGKYYYRRRCRKCKELQHGTIVQYIKFKEVKK